MLLSKKNGTSVGNWLFGLVCASIGFVAAFMANRIKALGRVFKPAVPDVVLTPEQVEQLRQSFFTSTFSIMGHVAKANGPIQKSQIAIANNIMQRMKLNAQRRGKAIALFNEGKQSDFLLDRQTKRFRDDCACSKDMYRLLLEMQIEMALANGYMSHQQEAILLHIAKVLGISEATFRQMEVLARISLGLGDNHNNRCRADMSDSVARQQPRRRANTAMYNACAVLGVQHDDSRTKVKAAYRKLMNQYHPDKLESQGLPEEMRKLSTDKAQEIQKAYEQIKLAKFW